MSVIGRLDKQVEEILISPLDKKGERVREDERVEEQAVKASTEDTNARPSTDKKELPVWLL